MFDELLSHHVLQEKMKQIKRYLIRLGADRNDADDIVQETMYKALLYIDSISPQKFSAWLFKVALNRYYDLYRKKQRTGIPIEFVDIEGAEVPESVLLRKEQREEIEQVLAELNPIYKQLIIMKYELDLSYQEIASLLSIKVEMVKTYLSRARKQFQKKYGGKIDERSRYRNY
jgi:RNA polymerase sigma factor (sigma-70 family)